MERAEQMYKDGVMSRASSKTRRKNYQLVLNKQVSAQRNLAVSRAADCQVRSAGGSGQGVAGKCARRSAQLYDHQPD